MKTWILAAGLLSIAPVSDLLVWAFPPQPEPIVIEERGTGYSPKDKKVMAAVLRRVDEEQKNRNTFMSLYPDRASQQEVDVATASLTDKQKRTRLWGKYTRYAEE